MLYGRKIICEFQKNYLNTVPITVKKRLKNEKKWQKAKKKQK